MRRKPREASDYYRFTLSHSFCCLRMLGSKNSPVLLSDAQTADKEDVLATQALMKSFDEENGAFHQCACTRCTLVYLNVQ